MNWWMIGLIAWAVMDIAVYGYIRSNFLLVRKTNRI